MARVLLALGGVEVSAQSDTLWTYTAPANIRFTRVGPSGHLLVATEQSLVALNAELGSVAWTYPVSGRLWLRVSSLGHVLVGYGGVMTALDPVTGDGGRASWPAARSRAAIAAILRRANGAGWGFSEYSGDSSRWTWRAGASAGRATASFGTGPPGSCPAAV